MLGTIEMSLVESTQPTIPQLGEPSVDSAPSPDILMTTAIKDMKATTVESDKIPNQDKPQVIEAGSNAEESEVPSLQDMTVTMTVSPNDPENIMATLDIKMEAEKLHSVTIQDLKASTIELNNVPNINEPQVIVASPSAEESEEPLLQEVIVPMTASPKDPEPTMATVDQKMEAGELQSVGNQDLKAATMELNNIKTVDESQVIKGNLSDEESEEPLLQEVTVPITVSPKDPEPIVVTLDQKMEARELQIVGNQDLKAAIMELNNIKNVAESQVIEANLSGEESEEPLLQEVTVPITASPKDPEPTMATVDRKIEAGELQSVGIQDQKVATVESNNIPNQDKLQVIDASSNAEESEEPLLQEVTVPITASPKDPEPTMATVDQKMEAGELQSVGNQDLKAAIMELNNIKNIDESQVREANLNAEESKEPLLQEVIVPMAASPDDPERTTATLDRKQEAGELQSALKDLVGTLLHTPSPDGLVTMAIQVLKAVTMDSKNSPNLDKPQVIEACLNAKESEATPLQEVTVPLTATPVPVPANVNPTPAPPTPVKFSSNNAEMDFEMRLSALARENEALRLQVAQLERSQTSKLVASQPSDAKFNLLRNVPEWVKRLPSKMNGSHAETPKICAPGPIIQSGIESHQQAFPEQLSENPPASITEVQNAIENARDLLRQAEQAAKWATHVANTANGAMPNTKTLDVHPRLDKFPDAMSADCSRPGVVTSPDKPRLNVGRGQPILTKVMPSPMQSDVQTNLQPKITRPLGRGQQQAWWPKYCPPEQRIDPLSYAGRNQLIPAEDGPFRRPDIKNGFTPAGMIRPTRVQPPAWDVQVKPPRAFHERPRQDRIRNQEEPQAQPSPRDVRVKPPRDINERPRQDRIRNQEKPQAQPPARDVQVKPRRDFHERPRQDRVRNQEEPQAQPPARDVQVKPRRDFHERPRQDQAQNQEEPRTRNKFTETEIRNLNTKIKATPGQNRGMW